MTATSRRKFNPWKADANQPNRAPKPSAGGDARHMSAVNRPLAHHYTITASLDGKSKPLLSTRDGSAAWDMLHALPEARSYVDDAGRLMAFRGKWQPLDGSEDGAPVLEPTARRGRGARGREVLG